MDLFGSKKRKQEREFNREVSLAVVSELERFASAAAEHIKAYPELAEIAQKRVHPDYVANNLHQQSGFSAEVKTVARQNAESLIEGHGPMISRTDNVGAGNHPEFDHVQVDADGTPLRTPDGGFVGGAQQKLFKSVEKYRELYGIEFEHYEKALLEVPSDQLPAIEADWSDQISRLEEQRRNRVAAGDREQAALLEEKIRKIRHAEQRLRDSSVSTEDAMEARTKPLLSACKDTIRVSHRSGVLAAKTGGGVAGGMSVLKNLAACCREGKDVGEAVRDVAVDTGKGTAVAYATGFASATVGGALKASSSQICKNLAKKGGPAAVVQTAAILATQTTKLLSGKTTGAEFVEAIGVEGANLASSLTGSNLGAIVGTAVLPGVGTLVGGVVGGLVASMMSGAVYRELQESIRATRMSDQHREEVVKACAFFVEQERQYRANLEDVFDRFLSSKEADIKYGFESVSSALQEGRSIQPGLQRIGDACGIRLRFDDVRSLDDHIKTGKALEL